MSLIDEKIRMYKNISRNIDIIFLEVLIFIIFVGLIVTLR